MTRSQKPTTTPAEVRQGVANPWEGGSPAATEAGTLGRVALDVEPGEQQELSTKPESTVSEATKGVCDYLSSMFAYGNTQLEMPKCSDVSVLQSVLDRLEDSPIALGWGEIPERITTAWRTFTDSVLHEHRKRHQLGPADLVQINIGLPTWVQERGGLDILSHASFVDATITGNVSGELAKGAQHSRITIHGNLGKSSHVGEGAKWSKFFIDGNVGAQQIFSDAENIDVHFKGDVAGTSIGTVTNSRLTLDGSASNCSVDAQGDSSVANELRRRGAYGI